MANPHNQDHLFGRDIPSPPLGIMGIQYADSLAAVNDKKPTDGPPISIAVANPGINATSDAFWVKTYGSSLDAFLSLVNGNKLNDSYNGILVQGIFQQGTANATNINLWDTVTSNGREVQQIQYIVSKATAEEGSTAVDTFGTMAEARGIGLRLPAMAAGWGRTIDGRPTDPNPTNPRANDDEHKLARETWKTGPLDARWDYNRNVWATYNDLIADHGFNGIGTWVFGTNNHTTEGFPFIRGTLEDVWWTRKTFALKDENGSDEGVKTGEVMTHLEHRFFDEEENGAAPLSSVFIVPHTNGTSPAGSDGPHDKGNEYIVDTEITGDSDFLDIRTTAHFWKEANVCGPIKFGAKVSDLLDSDLICCKSSSAKYFVGEMIYRDEPIVDCNGNPDPTVFDWLPSVQIDECQLAGDHYVDLVTNDASLGIRISQVCNDISTWSTNLKTNISATNSTFASTMGCLNREIQDLALNASNALAMVSSNDTTFTADVGNAIEDILLDLVEQINAAFDVIKACTLCEVDTTVTLDVGHAPWYRHAEIAPVITADKCPIGSFANPPDFPCTNCFGTHLLGPCVEPATFTAGGACGAAVAPDISTQYGECQAHD